MKLDKGKLLVGVAVVVSMLVWVVYVIPFFEGMAQEGRGCASKTWRNPVTGREERIGPWPGGCNEPSRP